MRKFVLVFMAVMAAAWCHAQQPDTLYQSAYRELTGMLNGTEPLSFKRAVFVTENAYMGGKLEYEVFQAHIAFLAHLAGMLKAQTDYPYKGKDIGKVSTYWSAYRVLKDSIPLIFQNDTLQTIPYTYDFEDFFGEKDWSKMFVSKLLNTRNGNCHSLPFLYKIVVEEMGEKAWLAMSPNHTYIKQWTEETGWFNTELTNGRFPLDAWIMTTGYVKLEAVQNRVYMDTLSAKQSIAVTLTDLAQGYQKKYGKGDTTFVMACLNEALEHYPRYAHARLIKAETLKSQYTALMDKAGAQYPTDLWHDKEAKVLFDRLEREYLSLYGLGYRQMPKKMYLNWLMDIKAEQTNEELERYTFTAPQPFAQFGYKVKVSTLSNGKYPEFFDLDTIAPIGTALINNVTYRLEGFVEYDTVYSEATLEPQVISRWLSPDPLSDKYSSWSPYNFTLNNPILFNDPDGREVIAKTEAEQELIRNTISQEAAGYLKFNKHGKLKTSSVNKAIRKLGDEASENLKNLSTLSKSNDFYQVQLSDKYGEIDLGMDEDTAILGIATDDAGNLGRFIEKEGTNEDPHRVAINATASEEKQVETTAHEAYGHAYFFNSDKNIKYYGHIHELRYSFEEKGMIKVDTNKKLDKHIKRAEALARKFYQERQKK